MGADDERALAALNERRAIFRTSIEARRGQVVDTAGDSVLATFESVVEAVRCAIEVQDAIANLNRELPSDSQMVFRIGVNSGDVIQHVDGTVYGDGVNIAARLESLAEPGRIVISEDSYRNIRHRDDFDFDDIGEQRVKNIAESVRAYRLLPNGKESTRPHASPRKSRHTLVAMGSVALVVAALVAWQSLSLLEDTRERPVQATEPEAGPIADLTAGPAIAVLPFKNMSQSAEHEYFADGIAEDLITELSRLRWLQVTARNSTFTYKGRPVDIKPVGRDLRVGYVVEGSVRMVEDRVRISAQLIDAASGNHIWAERYDRELSDIFALQDEIADTLVGALQGEVGEFERESARRRPPESLDAWASYQRGLWHLWRFNAADMAEARSLFQRAASLDPNFAQAFAALGFSLYLEVIFFYTESPLENLEQASRAVDQALSLDDKDAMAHHTLGRTYSLRGDYDSAIAELRKAIELNPSSALAHFGLGTTLILVGRFDDAISEFDTAIRLSPRDPATWGFYALRAWAKILSGDYEAAVEDSRRAIRDPAAEFWPYAHLASALAAHSPLNPEALQPVFETWIDGLRMAGLDMDDEPAPTD